MVTWLLRRHLTYTLSSAGFVPPPHLDTHYLIELFIFAPCSFIAHFDVYKKVIPNYNSGPVGNWTLKRMSSVI